MRAHEFIVEYKKYPTQDYEGIKISMVEKDGRLFVRAIDDWGVNELGSVEFVIGDGKELDPQDLQVDDRYQGQGIARTMYDYVKSQGYKIVRSWDQTDAGAGFWNKHRGEDVRVWEDKQQGVTAYHGNQGGIHKELITPMWWTEDRDTAVYYATQYGGDGYVYTATLSCKNPYVITDKDETNTMVEKYKALAQQGYDSIYDPRGHDWIPFYNKDIRITDKEYLDGEEQGVAEGNGMLAEEQPEVRPHRVTDKELVQLLGKGKTNAMLRHPWFQRYSSYEKAYRYARDRWGFVTVDMFPYMTSVNKTADGSIRPTIYVSFIFSYTGPKVVQAHQFRRDQEPDEFEKRNPVTGGWKHGSTWKVDKTDEIAEDAIQEDAVMGKIEQSGKIVRILKKQHTVPFSDEKDWLLIDTDPARGNRGLGLKWIPAHTRFEWVRPYRDTVEENFADGRGPGRPGDSQRHGIRKGATMAELEKAAKASGRKGQLARWQLNMRRGRKK